MLDWLVRFGEVVAIGDEPANTINDRRRRRLLCREAKESYLPCRSRVRLLSVCLTAKPVGEPDASIAHVRFDERVWETERCRMAQATASILDSTEPKYALAVGMSAFQSRPD
jgi:hypothetical protein